MRMNERSIIYWTFNNIENDFNIQLNERAMTTISTDTTLMMTNLWMLKKWSTTFISNIQQKLTKKIHSCEHELLKKKDNVTNSSLFSIYSQLYS